MLLCICSSSQSSDKYSVFYDQDTKEYTIKEGIQKEEAVAITIYEKSFLEVGWDKLYIESNPNFSEKIRTYAAGYIEGFVTKERIYDHWRNMHQAMFGNSPIPQNVIDFITKHDKFVSDKVEFYDPDSEYGRNIAYAYIQLQGLMAGYNDHVDSSQQIDLVNFYTIAAMSDMDDIMKYKNPVNFESQTESFLQKYLERNLHCSSLIKMKSDLSDMWFSHNTWNRYAAMTRIMKTYKLHFNTISGGNSDWSSFSSYPGTLSSHDDFYVLSNNLVIMETTNPVMSDELFELIKPEDCFLSWHRMVVANRIAENGEKWAYYMQMDNSGTYNNQYMIMDLNKIDTDKKAINDKALTILEQIPGESQTFDGTDFLRFGYWQSYNVFFSQDFMDKAGVNKYIAKFPQFKAALDYHQSARARIIRRDASSLDSIEDIMNFIRYNDYLNDPISEGKPFLTISARHDLGENDAADCMGAYDAKVGSIRDVKNKEIQQAKFKVVAGPTNQNLPSFNWSSDICKEVLHEGMPSSDYQYNFIDYFSSPEAKTEKLPPHQTLFLK